MNPILDVKGLYGGYLLNRPVLHNVSFSINKGQMVGLIGLNGAGKSTIIKHILGLLKPSNGNIHVVGRSLEEDPIAYRSAYAYVPENPELYDELTVREHLQLNAMAYGVDSAIYRERSRVLAKEFQMIQKMDSLPSFLSKGMRQKAMIMNAFLIEPQLYIIDEPFLGLDPLGIRSLLELMDNHRSKGASFLVSSHILSTIERYCDSYVVLHHGHTIAKGTLSEIKQHQGLSDSNLEETFFSLLQKEVEG